MNNFVKSLFDLFHKVKCLKNGVVSYLIFNQNISETLNFMTKNKSNFLLSLGMGYIVKCEVILKHNK